MTHSIDRRVAAVAAAFVVALTACGGGAPPEPVDDGLPLDIVYLANAGFLLASGGDRVLIDGLARNDDGVFAGVDAASRERVETAEPPFDTVDVVLATHHHADHYHPGAVCRFLASNPLAEFVSTTEALELIRNGCPDPGAFAGRTHEGLDLDGNPVPFVQGELRIEAAYLHHGAANPTENLGFFIEIGGLNVVHLGDSQVGPEELRALGWGERGIDVAFVPYWYFVTAAWVPAVNEVLKPNAVVVTHVPPVGSPHLEPYGGREPLVGTILNRFDNALVFEETFETRVY